MFLFEFRFFFFFYKGCSKINVKGEVSQETFITTKVINNITLKNILNDSYSCCQNIQSSTKIQVYLDLHGIDLTEN